MSDKQLVSAANGLGFKLVPHVHKQGKNTIFFPSSVSPVAAMLLTGADGQTAAELAQALGLQSSDTAELGALLGKLKSRGTAGSDFELLVQNAIWTHTRYPLRADYLATCRKDFDAECDNLDFADNHGSSDVINQWADKNTKGRIPKVVEPDQLDDTVRLVAANATCFDGAWIEAFDKQATTDRDFNLADGGKIKAPTMYTTGDHLQCWETADYDVLKLGYKGDASMVLVLPAKGKSVSSVFPSLGTALDTVDGVSPGYFDEVHAYLPRVKASDSIDLIEPFRAIGVNAPFDPFSDFSRMIDIANPSQDYVSITDFFQKSMFEMDEEGARGAAVTVAIGKFTTTSVMPRPRRIKTLRFDRPFVAMVRDDLTGLVIGVFVIENPAA